MSTRSNLAIVEGFLAAIEARDFDLAGSFLNREHFNYVGPTVCFDSAMDFIADIRRVGQIMKRVERRKVFVDGRDVMVVMDFLTTVTELERTRVAEWFTLEGDRINRIEVFFDAYPYNKMFEV